MKSERPPSGLDPGLPFVDRLEHQLRAASIRNIEQGNEPATDARRQGRWLAYAAVILLLVGAVAFWPNSQKAVAADVFEIERSGSSVEVSVIDLIDDGDDAIEELGEAGLDVEVAMVPVSPSLVGRLVAVESLGGIDLELVSVDGVVIDSFVAEAGSGPLLLEIGEPAEGEEPYVYSSEPGLCASFGRPISVDDVRAALGGPNHEIRWFQAEGAEVEEVAEADLVALAIVVTEVVPEHINASVVFATTDTSHPGCE